jgi:hypothetical protein
MAGARAAEKEKIVRRAGIGDYEWGLARNKL